jgi:hypothetical protein
MFANIYSTLSKPIRRIRRPEDRSEVINWFVDSRANVASDILTHHEFGAFYGWLDARRTVAVAFSGISAAVRNYSRSDPPLAAKLGIRTILLSLPPRRWRKTTRTLAVIAGAVAGLAALLVYLGTKEEKAAPFLHNKPGPISVSLPLSINVRDVRAVETRQLPQSPEGINVAVSATVEKNGNERVQCQGELLVSRHIIHQKYIHYWGYKTEAALIFQEGIARNEIWAYFAVPDDQYSENAEFRFDCNELSTTWLPVSLRRAPPAQREK